MTPENDIPTAPLWTAEPLDRGATRQYQRVGSWRRLVDYDEQSVLVWSPGGTIMRGTAARALCPDLDAAGFSFD